MVKKQHEIFVMKIKARRFFWIIFVIIYFDISVNQLSFSRLLQSKVKPRI